METVYIDIEEENMLGFFIKDINKKVVLTGTTIERFNNQDKDTDIVKQAKDNYIDFIFEDTLLSVDFYCVPRFNIFAFDDHGYYGMLGNYCDLDDDRPIYYVNHNKQCFKYAKNFQYFIEKMGQQKEHLEKYTDITFYDSKEEAKQEFNFLNINSYE